MRYLYLDESGDLGHDLTKIGTSRYFVITILEIRSIAANKAIEKAISRTLINKIHRKHSRKSPGIIEVKATNTTPAIKRYFYNKLSDVEFYVYSVILDKKKFVTELQYDKLRVYRFITQLVLKEIPLGEATQQVVLALDRMMGSAEIRGFNELLRNQVETWIRPSVSLSIYHDYSHENKPIQAVDLFSWGIYRKHEVGDTEWYDAFKARIKYEQVYPSLK